MYQVITTKPSTFYSESSPVKILDDCRNVFYFHPNKEKKINFNLPIGKYFTRERIYRKPAFIPYSVDYEPIDTRGFKIRIGNNPNKATITPLLKYIFLDKKIANHKFKPLIRFVLGHEMSHTLEKGKGMECTGDNKNFCDTNSANKMLAEGYNPSQINEVRKLLMSDNFRSDCLRFEIIKPQYRR